jgi:Reverse transcriptase (RNA-dependent DNA polymerase)
MVCNFCNANVSSAYLEAMTKEKVYIVAGPEFGDLADHTVIISKALYGLRTSSQCWHERFADIMCDIGFVQLLADGTSGCVKEETCMNMWHFMLMILQ